MYKLLFISLGCDKNLVDSEQMSGLLAENGYSFTQDEYEADVIIINSCCFIGDAKEESINTIIEMGQLKENGCLKALIVTGCLAQRYAEEIKTELPEVDAVLGTTAFDEIIECVSQTLEGKKYFSRQDINKYTYLAGIRSVTTGGHFAYLKIAEGCDKHCTYCVIPYVRGGYRSVPMDVLVEDAKLLAEKGVRELVIVAQETTVYGCDIYGRKALPELLNRLSEINGIYWIRLLYCYPEEITDELISVIRDNKKVCHYIDMPLQSGSDAVLARMGRRTTSSEIRTLVNKLRKEIPDICLRTSIICGFPGETEENHQETLSLINELEFDRLGAFRYSPEEGTKAFMMDNQIGDDIKEDRVADVMELQQEIAFEKNDEMIGRKLLAFVEGKLPEENAYVARTYRDAPGVDGLIFINTDAELMTGDFVKVTVTGSAEYDLTGEM